MMQNLILVFSLLLVSYTMTKGQRGKEHLIQDIIDLDVGMYDVFMEKNLLTDDFEDISKGGKTEDQYRFIVMLIEAEFVANEMRKEMESPMTEEGRFKGKDLFTAMAISKDKDVRSFLRYVRKYPSKYQAQKWKFAEIYATWINEGAPTIMEDYEMMMNEGMASVSHCFVGIEEKLGDKVLDKAISKAGRLAEEDKTSEAIAILYQAREVAELVGNKDKLAWSHYTRGKIYIQENQNELAKAKFEEAMELFQVLDNKAAILIVGNDIGFNLNGEKSKKSYKAAEKVLLQSIEISKQLPIDDEAISPVIALVHRNLGDTYMGLKDFEKAESIYTNGLKYTQFKGATALKRRATIEMKLSELYNRTRKTNLAQEYEKKAVLTYKEYEAELKRKKL